MLSLLLGLLMLRPLGVAFGTDFNIGFVSTGEMGLPFQTYSSAINIAIDDFFKEGWLQDHTVK